MNDDLDFLTRLYAVLRRGYITSHLHPLFEELKDRLTKAGVDVTLGDSELLQSKAAIAPLVAPKRSKKTDISNEGETN